MPDWRTSQRKTWQPRGGFTLVELLVAVAIVALLAALLLPCLAGARKIANRVVCVSNLRSMSTAYMLYLEDNGGRFFPYQQALPDGTLWYWGFEPFGHGAPEGQRPIDKSRARLAPYYPSPNGIKGCPEMPYGRSYFKPKFRQHGYGYAINYYMLEGNSGDITTFYDIGVPAETIAWGEAMQINTWQAPASPQNPMLEEWYFLANPRNGPRSFHFRHDKKCNAVFADGSIHALEPYSLDAACDGLVGRPERRPAPGEVPYLLGLTDK